MIASKKPEIESVLYDFTYKKLEEQWHHVPYEQELAFLDLVRNGDVEALDSFPYLTMFSHTSHLSDNPIRQKKYEFVSTVAVNTRVAIEGGLDMETAYNLSDSFIRMIDKIDDMNGILAVFVRVPREFAMRVRESRKRSQLSRHLLRSIDYIENNLHYAITHEAIAAHVGINANYLSTIFKKEFGQSVKEYIISRRLEEAKRMLAHSEMSISEISNTLAFNSQSYFSLLFREHFHETPRQYRNRCFRESPTIIKEIAEQEGNSNAHRESYAARDFR